MMNEPKIVISEAEREVLKALWELGPSVVRQIRDYFEAHGRTWAHTTVNTLLSRLEEKQLVTRDTSGFAHVFSAAVSRDGLVQQSLTDLADQYCDGQSAPLMLALVEGQEFSDAEIDEFRQLLDRLEKNNSKKQPTKRATRKGKSSR